MDTPAFKLVFHDKINHYPWVPGKLPIGRSKHRQPAAHKVPLLLKVKLLLNRTTVEGFTVRFEDQTKLGPVEVNLHAVDLHIHLRHRVTQMRLGQHATVPDKKEPALQD